jgi:hypothetical protein
MTFTMRWPSAPYIASSQKSIFNFPARAKNSLRQFPAFGGEIVQSQPLTAAPAKISLLAGNSAH